ncbi:MAG TPA: PPOX class F420-dependent oxidoreductase [Nitriliruptorales bacterium]|nr:PPOX class F420-dependent oxidoreductase [Nitriliruptorales bacterium]
MSVFTDAELVYLRGQRLGRIATADAGCQPHVVPVGFRYNPDTDTLDVGGHNLPSSKKWRDVAANALVAFVVDDLASVTPWRPRGIEVRGRGELANHGGEAFGPGWAPEVIRIHPRRIIAWGLEQDARHPTRRTVGTP